MGPKKSESPEDLSADTLKESHENKERRLAEADAKLKAVQKSQEEPSPEAVSDLLMILGVDPTKIERDDSGDFTKKGIEAIREQIKALKGKKPFASIILEEFLHIRDRKAD